LKTLKKTYNYLFFLLVFTIPFEDDIRIIPNILIGVLAVILPFIEKNFKHFLYIKKSYLVAIGLMFFIGLTSFINGTISDDFYIIKKLLILIAVLILSVPIKKHTSILLFFIVSVFLGNIISIFNIVDYILKTENFEIASGQKINDLLFIERLYFGFNNSLNVAFSLVLWSKARKKLKIFLLISILLSVFMLLLVASRMAIITVFIILLIKIFYHINFKKSLITVALVLGTISAFFLLNDNLAKRFFYVDKKNDFVHKIREWEPRFVIWKCSYIHVKGTTYSLFFGDGFYKTQQNLNKCYIDSISKEKRLKFFLETRFNTHNQYLDLLMSKGLFGLSIFLFLIYWLYTRNKKDINKLNILLVLVLFSLVENFFHRQIGVYLFALILVVLTITDSEETILNE